MDDYLSYVEALYIDEIRHMLYVEGIKWKAYPNPMKHDSFFIAEDKEIEPYPDVKDLQGNLSYPATPKTEHCLGYGLRKILADKIVNYLNLPMMIIDSYGENFKVFPIIK